MKCDICKVRQATVHLTEVINDQVTKLHLCEECAREKGEEMQSHFGLTDLISGLMDMGTAIPEQEIKGKTEVRCPSCSMTYDDFRNTGKLGCGECYEVFKKNLGKLLRKIHGSDRHVGKMPFGGEKVAKEQDDLKRLRDDLNELVRSEKFEQAAVLRDRIKDLEKKIRDKQ